VRDFMWQVFTQTGDIEAYLLFKEVHNLGSTDLSAELGTPEEESIVGDEE
jgi:hypothetical protein